MQRGGDGGFRGQTKSEVRMQKAECRGEERTTKASQKAKVKSQKAKSKRGETRDSHPIFDSTLEKTQSPSSVRHSGFARCQAEGRIGKPGGVCGGWPGAGWQKRRAEEWTRVLTKVLRNHSTKESR